MAHRLAPEAEADLHDIWYYVAQESGSIEIADGCSTLRGFDGGLGQTRGCSLAAALDRLNSRFLVAALLGMTNISCPSSGQCPITSIM